MGDGVNTAQDFHAFHHGLLVVIMDSSLTMIDQIKYYNL